MDEDNTYVGVMPADYEHIHCTVIASDRIEKGDYIQPAVHGTVRVCQNTDVLVDPMGRSHYPNIIGYVIDGIEDGDTGRAVFQGIFP